VSSRINSTWGGNLADMVRSRRILEVIERDGLIARAAEAGHRLRDMLESLAAAHTGVSDVRGRGLMCAFTIPSAQLRDEILTHLRTDEHVLMLGCGGSSLRVRPALTISVDELDRGIAALDRVLTALNA
jgi:L-lysine 6-transaminase